MRVLNPADQSVGEWQVAEPGVMRRLVANGELMTAIQVQFEVGARGAMHQHPHEQITFVQERSFTFFLGEDEIHVTAGDTITVPSGVTHGRA